MFYDKNQLDSELLCKYCEGRIEIPKILPCGETICSLCESTIQASDHIFDLVLYAKKNM